jgi:heat shock protein beta
MNKADLIANLGRIAESGTKRFTESMGKNKDAVSLIGQFGVGFYSGFLVADRMTVITKGSEGQQLKWEALAESLDEYTIAPDSADSPAIETTGTRIILHLKEEADQYLDDVALRALIEKYSEFIPFPIE